MSWFLAFAGFALLVVLHEAGHFAVAKAVGMRVERFSLFFPPLLLRKKLGETEYAVGAIPLGGYVKISGMHPDEDLPDEVKTRAYHAQPVWKRVLVIAAGPAVNLVLALVLLIVFFAAIGAQGPSDRVGAVARDLPAQGTIEPGDRLIAVDGRRGSPAELSMAIDTHRCAGPPAAGCRAAEPASLLLERNGRPLRLELRPAYDAAPGIERMRLGFRYASGPRETLPLGAATTVALDRFWFISKETMKLPARLIDAEQRKQISGVIGAYEITRQTILDDVADAVGILAVISLSLAIINLFPFLPLDGGHIFWAVVEKVRRKPVPYRVMERAGMVGFILVLGLFAIGLTNDIGRLAGEGFNVR